LVGVTKKGKQKDHTLEGRMGGREGWGEKRKREGNEGVEGMRKSWGNGVSRKG